MLNSKYVDIDWICDIFFLHQTYLPLGQPIIIDFAQAYDPKNVTQDVWLDTRWWYECLVVSRVSVKEER